MKMWNQLVICLVVIATVADTKCLDEPDVLPKRKIMWNSLNGGKKELPLVLENSSRLSHQLTNAILKILLEEKLGYNKVEFNNTGHQSNVSEVLTRVAGCLGNSCPLLDDNKVVVNMETWVPPGYTIASIDNSMIRARVTDAGPLGPFGRFGWYIPNSFVDQQWKDHELIVDHWRVLQVGRITDKLSLKNNDIREVLLSKMKRPGIHRQQPYYCDSPKCIDGMLVADRCHRSRPEHNCATLLSSYTDLDSGQLEATIKNHDLKVNIAWLGEQLESFVTQCAEENIPTLFYNWEPNVLTNGDEFTRIKFDQRDFEKYQMRKMIWKELANAPGGKPAHDLFQSVHFTTSQYNDLLSSVKSLHPDINELACDWIKTHQPVWEPWMPSEETLSEGSKLYIGGIFTQASRAFSDPASVYGATMAIKDINANPDILKGYTLELLVENSSFDKKTALEKFIGYIYTKNPEKKVVGIMGPGLRETKELVQVANLFSTIIINYSEFEEYDDKHYPFFFNAKPSERQISQLYVEMFHQLGWSRVGLLISDGYDGPEEVLQDNSIDVITSIKVADADIIDNATAQKYLQQLKLLGVTIIVVHAEEYSTAVIMKEAFHQKMTAEYGYVWFLPYTPHWSMRNFEFEMDIEVVKATLGAMSLDMQFLDKPDTQVIGDHTVEQWKQSYMKTIKQEVGQNAYPSPLAPYTYESAWVFALALDRLNKEIDRGIEELFGEKKSNTFKNFTEFVSEIRFQGLAGEFSFQNNRRPGVINLFQYQMDSSQLINSSHLELVGQYKSYTGASERLNLTKVVWYDGGQIPSDIGDLEHSNSTELGPLEYCHVEALRAALGITCNEAKTVANIMGAVGFILIVMIALVVIKKRYDRKMKRTRARMQELGLMSDFTWLSLDEWEMARDQVVLNRKLGEGAFGTVYGGKCCINNEWQAVAVKTLKIGSTVEEKLDFLSEANIMKRFNHENIVKLRGVCTRGEPAYAIMEFMLFGDLKSYLSARRDLVGSKSKESHDVSALSLTRMALDVARGLKYLSDLNYVHRDIACRNMLLNSEKVVKIGDFGLTRSMYDSDYYRCNRKGRFPVRWWAPESLSEGKFTSKADMWSYGILLYEISTFGSFPYQGLSNNQVLKYVTSGFTLWLPKDINSKLRTLLMQCWLKDPEKRPTCDQIINVIHHNSKLIVPCLDAPMASVALETNGETGSDSLELPVSIQASQNHKLLRSVSEPSKDPVHPECQRLMDEMADDTVSGSSIHLDDLTTP
ncbi:unnamed protein product [Owenia fusiformis]|uniref:Protein kinase domain-containing protein n=1 Tax=Owenia fusiformis TaxID=6347 RepID=A0A8S4NG86_OWEFU|nr:unnamed protein product [Owenia fusiformis]